MIMTDEKKFIKLLTDYEHPAIIVYITDSGDLKLQTSGDLELTQRMLGAAADFVLQSKEVDVSDGYSEFVNKINLH
jgi:hypothetical protein